MEPAPDWPKSELRAKKCPEYRKSLEHYAPDKPQG